MNRAKRLTKRRWLGKSLFAQADTQMPEVKIYFSRSNEAMPMGLKHCA
jgi:hypothetical protein